MCASVNVEADFQNWPGLWGRPNLQLLPARGCWELNADGSTQIWLLTQRTQHSSSCEMGPLSILTPEGCPWGLDKHKLLVKTVAMQKLIIWYFSFPRQKCFILPGIKTLASAVQDLYPNPRASCLCITLTQTTTMRSGELTKMLASMMSGSSHTDSTKNNLKFLCTVNMSTRVSRRCLVVFVASRTCETVTRKLPFVEGCSSGQVHQWVKSIQRTMAALGSHCWEQ